MTRESAVCGEEMSCCAVRLRIYLNSNDMRVRVPSEYSNPLCGCPEEHTFTSARIKNAIRRRTDGPSNEESSYGRIGVVCAP
jgi:hypothetical protein